MSDEIKKKNWSSLNPSNCDALDRIGIQWGEILTGGEFVNLVMLFCFKTLEDTKDMPRYISSLVECLKNYFQYSSCLLAEGMAKICTKYYALDGFLRAFWDQNHIGLLSKSHININPLCRIQNWKSTSTNILINNSVSWKVVFMLRALKKIVGIPYIF